MIKVIKKANLPAKNASQVKPERKPADFWVKESLSAIKARKENEQKQFFK